MARIPLQNFYPRSSAKSAEKASLFPPLPPVKSGAGLVASALHLFRRGGHGFGIREAQGPIARWPSLCADWLKEIGVLR
jgi:hypothetical protein